MIHDNIFNNYVLNLNFKELFNITDDNNEDKNMNNGYTGMSEIFQ